MPTRINPPQLWVSIFNLLLTDFQLSVFLIFFFTLGTPFFFFWLLVAAFRFWKLKPSHLLFLCWDVTLGL
ncbi:hypothetical protein V6N13_024907 [Hibiscus sabdariffa]|uniref:Uncharacterized protein n=1 Tax=Hibiscus sabdariffa TaxID=183260 RepID=A0ABR1ZWN9_9ROSI